jgi:uncharacterized protein YqeY
MSLREQIQSAQITAMKERNEEKLSILRILWSAIRNAEIDKKENLTDVEIQEAVSRLVKQQKDALQDFTAGGRQDLADKAQKEITLLQAYLPQQLTDEELKEIVKKVISENNLTEAGRAVGVIMKEVKGRADGNKVKLLVEEILKA